MELFVYRKEFEDYATSNLSCFCRRPGVCPIKGTMDLFPCVQVPVSVSLPHFLRGDPSLLSNVASGLTPSEENHEFFIGLEWVIILNFRMFLNI